MFGGPHYSLLGILFSGAPPDSGKILVIVVGAGQRSKLGRMRHVGLIVKTRHKPKRTNRPERAIRPTRSKRTNKPSKTN